jgi:hypothetical protein
MTYPGPLCGHEAAKGKIYVIAQGFLVARASSSFSIRIDKMGRRELRLLMMLKPPEEEATLKITCCGRISREGAL